MKFRDYIEQNHVFTTEQLKQECGLSPASIKTMLNRAHLAGQIERVRRGVYVSRIGYFAKVNADAFEIVQSIDPQAIFVFHTALEVYGIAHNVYSVCQFESTKIKSAFTYSGTKFQPYACAKNKQTVKKTQTIRQNNGLRVRVTSREQTIADCLEHPAHAGGIEEALMSVSLFPYVDTEELKKITSGKSASLAARIGWLLEHKANSWNITPKEIGQFEAMAKGGPFKLSNTQIASLGWSKRWKLCLPADKTEVESWIL